MAPPRTSLGELTTLPRPPRWWGGGCSPPQEPHPALGHRSSVFAPSKKSWACAWFETQIPSHRRVSHFISHLWKTFSSVFGADSRAVDKCRRTLCGAGSAGVCTGRRSVRRVGTCRRRRSLRVRRCAVAGRRSAVVRRSPARRRRCRHATRLRHRRRVLRQVTAQPCPLLLVTQSAFLRFDAV